DLAVSASGFKKYQAKGVVLRVADKARVDVALQVGAISEQVVVEGTQVAQVETQSSDLSGTVTGAQISNLALNGRNFTQLVTLAPSLAATLPAPWKWRPSPAPTRSTARPPTTVVTSFSTRGTSLTIRHSRNRRTRSTTGATPSVVR